MWAICFENSRVSRKARIFSDHFPLFLEAGSFLWGPSPFRFCNTWLVSSDSNQIIVETVSNSNFQGWAGFILHEQLRSVKLAVKAWNIAAQAKVKKKTEKSLMSKLEKYDSVAELIGLNQKVDWINSNWSCVSSIQNEALVTQFSVEEIFKALKALGNNKARARMASQ